jgi:murein peptide amidase A
MCTHRNPNRSSDVGELRRIGKNNNGYRGETIDIDAVLADCVAAARTHGWTVEEIPASPDVNLLAFTRIRTPDTAQPDGGGERNPKGGPRALRPASPRPRVYLSTGIHGDEPAGPLAVRQLLQANQWPAALDLWLCPCLNPAGFLFNRRENAENFDLNRQYREPQAGETLAHIAWLKRQPAFDLCLCLHEDWESHGFYVYELNPEHRPSLAEPMVESVSEVCPIDRSEMIEGRPARNGIIRPDIDPRVRPQWPEAFYLLTHKTRLSYTLEAPSDFPLPVRVAALVTAVETALSQLMVER